MCMYIYIYIYLYIYICDNCAMLRLLAGDVFVVSNTQP